MNTWYFVRHGQSVANRDGWLAGHFDAPLSPLGVRQSQRMVPQMRSIELSRVFCSDLSRAHLTAKIITSETPVSLQVDAHVRERHLGEWEQKRRDWALKSDRKKNLMSWDVGPPGGESRRDVALRIFTWINTLDPAPSTLLVAHGTLLGAIVGMLDGTPVEEIGWSFMPNATLFKRTVAPEQWRHLLASI